MFRRVLLLAVTTVAVLSGAMLAPGAATAAQAATCTGGVAVSQFAFNPSSVPPGGSSPLTLVLSNCTSQTIQGSTDWFGTYAGRAALSSTRFPTHTRSPRAVLIRSRTRTAIPASPDVSPPHSG